MSKFLLNADGTVNLADAEHALHCAEVAEKNAYDACRIAERAYRSNAPFSIAKARALAALDVARSNAEGASEAVKRAHGYVFEALNPDAA